MDRFVQFWREVALIYVVVVAMSAGIIWLANGFSDVGKLIFLFTAVAAIPGSIKIVLRSQLRDWTRS